MTKGKIKTAPGEKRTYYWFVPEFFGPVMGEDMCIPRYYYVDLDREPTMVGSILVCQQYSLDANDNQVIIRGFSTSTLTDKKISSKVLSRVQLKVYTSLSLKCSKVRVNQFIKKKTNAFWKYKLYGNVHRIKIFFSQIFYIASITKIKNKTVGSNNSEE